ncbi:Glycosyl hydrolase family 47 [Klebsormidium nitens]|uniref:alpha-1,2-Mannosidase n=1 Tax=Klebsormidium nitens TaxID=105231 RepID=A0A1Y1IC85_KLENI|nr:Glycosyl hydrolase family 47 [Klebsormidium nitens]|eukprot:GAQ88520.1 Glycosyl hydrolase family 47 [Klebsormidium nitens]
MAPAIRAVLFLICLLSGILTVNCQTEGVSRDEALELRDEVKSMFYRAYNNYMEHAFPLDELRPLSCSGEDSLGGYSLTLIDAMDTLALLGDIKEFARAVRWVSCNVNFDKNQTVSVFETNIRVLGGLLSAHLLASDPSTGMAVEQYTGKLLELAEDLGRRLLPAFYTATGIPFGSVNLQTGVLPEETTVTSTAGGGTLALEFGMLSRLTKDPVFEDMALNSLRGLWSRRSHLGLVGAHIDVYSGEWTHRDAGIGTSIDSFYEYLLKGHLLLGGDEYLHMFREAYAAAQRHLHQPPWYLEVNMDDGMVVWPLFNSLQAFWPGLQVLAGDVEAAAQTHAAFYGVWRRFGFTPEGFNLVNQDVQPGQNSYPLRPELAESTYWLYRATRDPMYLHVGRDIVASIQYGATCPCGYCHVTDVQTHEKEDHMESFFLSETVKYLWLLFDSALEGDNLVENGPYPYVFSTEGHLFPIRPDLSLEPFTESRSETDPKEQPEAATEPLSEGRSEPSSPRLEGSPSAKGWPVESETDGNFGKQRNERTSEGRETLAGSSNALKDFDGSPSSGTGEDGSGTADDGKRGLNAESVKVAEAVGVDSLSGVVSVREDGPELISSDGKAVKDGFSDAHKPLSGRSVTVQSAETERLTEEENGTAAGAGLAAVLATETKGRNTGAPVSELPLSNGALSDVSQEDVAGDAKSTADVSSPGSEAPRTLPDPSESPTDGSGAATCPSPNVASPLQGVIEASAQEEALEDPARVNDVSRNVTEATEGEEATWDIWTDEGVEPLVGRCPALSFWRHVGVHNMVPFPPSADTVINHEHILARHKQRQMHQMKMASLFQQAAQANGQAAPLPPGQKFVVSVNQQGADRTSHQSRALSRRSDHSLSVNRVLSSFSPAM